MVKESISVAVIVGSVIVAVLVAGVIIIVVVLWRKGILTKATTNKHRTKHEGTEADFYETVGMHSAQQLELSSVYQQLTEPTLTVYNNSDIALQSLIIAGEFYDIWKGKLKSKDNVALDVVIKSLKDSNVTYLPYLKEQGAAMCKLRSNDYTIACFGISQDNKYLLMENASLGNLQMYLREQSADAYYNVGSDQNLPTLMNFIHQVIKGVESVFHLQPPALFYCLSASNVLITNEKQCKLTGFATLTAVTEREKWEEEHNKTRPIRWLSPEAIKVNHIRKSDIWSLSVLLWEITNHGKQPLPDKTDEEVKELILSGHRLLKPVNCTNELYDILCSCWQYQPHSRPSVDDVESRLLEITQYEAV